MRLRPVTSFVLILLFMALAFTPLALADGPRVVASHGILADVAQNVAGENVAVSVLIPTGSDPHGYIPSPGDLTAVSNADLVFLNGIGYEESLLEAIEGAGEMVNIVNASGCILVRPFSAGMHHDEHDDDHADEHDDDHADEHDDDDHAADDHADEHDDEHADDDHADEHDDDHADEHDDDHADDDHADEHDDDHADEHDDEHADDDHADEADDDHADDHDDDHADEHDDDHADDDHADDHDDDHADEHEDDHAMDAVCDGHDAEFAMAIGDDSSRAEIENLGRTLDADCGLGHDDHEDEHGHHAHGEGDCDPHVWMDPYNAIYWALMIRDSLSQADPDHAESYAANAAAYIAELVALEADFIQPALADLPAEKRVLISSHESLGYFATTYSFEVPSTLLGGLETAVEPSARDIAAMIDTIRDEGIAAIFGDTQVSESIIRAIADEAGVEVYGLYADTLTSEDGPAATYLDYMRYNVSTIVDGLASE